MLRNLKCSASGRLTYQCLQGMRWRLRFKNITGSKINFLGTKIAKKKKKGKAKFGRVSFK
jgi:hypothetical protein